MKNFIQAFAFTPVAATTVVADTYQYCYEVPDVDRWMYPYNATPGTRIVGPTVTGYGSGVDDRYGQSLFGWVTIDIPTDLPAHAYTVVSMTVEASIANADVVLDETADDRSTHEPDASDPDAGRPCHLSGVGFRGDFVAGTFGDDGPFPFGAGVGERNAYALGFDNNGEPIDISNNLTEQFDPTLFAIGSSDDAEPGDFLPELVRFRFDVNIDDAYIMLSPGIPFLGMIDVTISSFHSGSQDGSGSYPQWILAEHPLVELIPGLQPHSASKSRSVIRTSPATPMAMASSTSRTCSRHWTNSASATSAAALGLQFGFTDKCRRRTRSHFRLDRMTI